MTLPENRFDVTIICTTDDHQAAFWMSKLDSEGDEQFPLVIAVSEDWNASGGAGNGLGTLYAWKKACEYAKEHCNGLDLPDLLEKGEISASLYHTAGKGTRMAPLPASENNNKPGVVSIIIVRNSTNQRRLYHKCRPSQVMPSLHDPFSHHSLAMNDIFLSFSHLKLDPSCTPKIFKQYKLHNLDHNYDSKQNTIHSLNVYRYRNCHSPTSAPFWKPLFDKPEFMPPPERDV